MTFILYQVPASLARHLYGGKPCTIEPEESFAARLIFSNSGDGIDFLKSLQTKGLRAGIDFDILE